MSHQKLSGPYSLEEMMAAKNEILTLESSIDDSWETWVDLSLGGSDSCRLFRRYLPDKGLYMYKSVIRMDFSASEYFEYYKDNEYRKTWDQTIQEVSCVAEEEDNEVVRLPPFLKKFPLNYDHLPVVLGCQVPMALGCSRLCLLPSLHELP